MSDLISRQVAIDVIEKLFPTNTMRNDYTEGITVGVALALDFIKQLPSAQQWTPVTEGLPKEEKETYWVCTDAGTQFECRWTNVNHFWTDLTTNWHWHIMDIPKYTKVVAWMELPEPYEGGDAE